MARDVVHLRVKRPLFVRSLMSTATVNMEQMEAAFVSAGSQSGVSFAVAFVNPSSGMQCSSRIHPPTQHGISIKQERGKCACSSAFLSHL